MSLNIKLLRKSFEAAKPAMPNVLDYFYDSLFKNYPKAQTLFNEVDMKKQKLALGAALTMVVDNLENISLLQKVLSEMGTRHDGYGVKAEHYEWVGSTLLGTFAHFLGKDWTNELAREWSSAYQFISSTMIEGASKKN